MRFLSALLIAGAVSSCSMAPPPDAMALSSQDEARLAALTAGKVAGAPVACLPRHRSNDMRTLDNGTVAFKVGSRVYINNMDGGCPNLRPPYALLTRQFGGAGLCRGDVAQIVDPTNGVSVGSCVWGDFIPYTRAGA